MKKIITMLFLLAISAGMNNSLFAQVNSVGLNGSFIYPSIAAAYAAIGVVASPELIELSATYTGSSEVFPIALGVKAGVSASNTITIRPSAGANGLALTSGVNNYVFILTGAFIIIDGRPGGVTSVPANYLSVSNTFTGAANGAAGTIQINGGDNCIYQYINATAAVGTLVPASTGARCINIAGSTANPSNDNLVQNCVIRGGLRGIQNFGLDAVTINQNCIIRNNDIAQFHAIGMLISNDNNTLIQNNKVHFTAAITTIATFLVGIQTQGFSSKVDQNEVYDFASLNAHSHLHIANFGANTTYTRNSIHDNIPVAAQFNVATGFQFSGTGRTYCSENFIYNLSLTTSGTILGMNIASNGAAIDTSLTIYKNKIWNLFTTSTSRIEAIRVITKTNNTVHLIENNISINGVNTAASGIFGIYASSSTGVGTDTLSKNYTANVRSNSVYIGGVNSGTVGVFVNSAGIFRDNFFPLSVYRQYHNNVIIERTTGDANFQFHLGFWLDTLTGTLDLDSNKYYSADPNLGYAAIWYDSLFRNTDIVEYRAYAAPNEASTYFANANFLKLTMNFEACPDKSPVTCELRSDVSPYNLVESVSGMAGGDFPNAIKFETALEGVPYYLVVKSANMIETWSATTVTFNSSGGNYDFTTSLAAAFGSNQKMSLSGIPSVYQGDVNQDGFVNLTDVTSVFNASNTFTTSPSTDFNCDGTTDLSDITVAYNNSNAFVQKVVPTGPAPSSAPVVTKTVENNRVQPISVSSLKVNGLTNTEVLGVERIDR